MHILLHCWFYMSSKTKTKHLWKINRPEPQRSVFQSVLRSCVKMSLRTNNCTILQRYNAEGFLNHGDNVHRRWSYFQHSNITGMKRISSPSHTPPSLVNQQPSVDPQKLHHMGQFCKMSALMRVQPIPHMSSFKERQLSLRLDEDGAIFFL